MSTTEYEVRCVGVMLERKNEAGVKVPEFARMGELVELTAEEAERLLAEGAVQKQGAAPLANSPEHEPGPTPFSQSAGPWVGPIMGDPNPNSPVGGLTPEEAAAFEAQAASGLAPDEEFVAAEATDEELLHYLETKKPNVEDTLILAMDDEGEYDPVLVERVLEAEQAREKPRSGVVDVLTAESESE